MKFQLIFAVVVFFAIFLEIHECQQKTKEAGSFLRFWYDISVRRCGKLKDQGQNPEARHTLSYRKSLLYENRRRVCSLPWDRGPCQQNLRRYYYDAARKKCYRVFYGGCGGNQNNFLYKKNCTMFCANV